MASVTSSPNRRSSSLSLPSPWEARAARRAWVEMPLAPPLGRGFGLGANALVDLGLPSSLRDTEVELDEELHYETSCWPPSMS